MTSTDNRAACTVGVFTQTIRYYEGKLLSPQGRRPSGYRLYDEEAQARIRFIKHAQGLGFTLREIGELLSLRFKTGTRCGDIRRTTQDKLRDIEARIKELQTWARALRSLIRTCRAGQTIEQCRIVSHLKTAQSDRPSEETDITDVFTTRQSVCRIASSQSEGNRRVAAHAAGRVSRWRRSRQVQAVNGHGDLHRHSVRTLYPCLCAEGHRQGSLAGRVD
ncbi:MAG: MerR family DNA-binding protein [Nitrospira sp.]|nr:MerR family DNA-binding protein [Nitrospira sp.]